MDEHNAEEKIKIAENVPPMTGRNFLSQEEPFKD
jgi:hypothetical protein